MKVLIVDDEPIARRGLRAQLAALPGIEFAGECANRADAVAEIVRRSPDVVLLDVQLGDEDGLELARRLDVELPDTPVILVSTHAEDELAELIADSPAIGFVPKRTLGAEAIAALLSVRRGT
jgi:DNA-binding NarL/FixJ family response regulator